MTPPIIASAGDDKPRELPDADLHNAVCAFVCDLGMYPDPRFGKVAHKVIIAWELEQKMADNRPFMLSKEYTLSLFEKSTLYKHLTSWKGASLTATELKGLDLETLIGKGCRVMVVHHVAQNGNTYANIDAVLPADKKAPTLAVVNKDPPKWFETKRQEYKAAMSRYEGGPEQEPESQGGGAIEEIPFSPFDAPH
jgi:hypothetical protein